MSRRSILLITFSQLFSYGVPLLTFPLLVRAFSIDDYGLWLEVSTIAGLMFSLLIPGLANAFNALWIGADDQRTTLTSAAVLYFSSGLLLTFMTFILAGPLSAIAIREPIGQELLRWIAAQAAIQSVLAYYMQVFRQRQHPGLNAALEIGQGVIRIVVAVLALLSRDLVLMSFLHTFLPLLLVIGFTFPAIRVIGIWGTFEFIHARKMWKQSLNFALANQSTWLVQYGDRLMLSILTVSSAVAIYSASYQICLVLIALGWPYLYGLLTVIGEHWRSGDVTGTQQIARQTSASMFLVMVPAVVGLTLVSNPLIRVLATEDFAQSGLLTLMIATGIAIDTLGGILHYLLYALERPHSIRNAYLQGAAFNLLANLVAIPWLGYNGAGLTTFLTFAYIFWRMWRSTGMPFQVLFDLNRLGRCLLACVPMAIWVLLTAQATLLHLLVAVGGGALFYGLGLLLTGVIQWSDVLRIQARIRSRLLPVTKN